MGSSTRERNSYLVCLTNADFLKFYAGQYISFIGDRLAQLAFIAVLMGTIQAGSAVSGADSKVTLLMLISLTPYIYMFPISGYIIDRFRRRNVMIVCTCLQGVVTIGAAEIIRAQGFDGVADAVIYISILLIYTNSAVFNPAKYALIPEIVEREHLLAANALNTSTATISTLIGTFAGALLIDHLYAKTGSETAGIVWSLYLDSLTFFIPGLLLLLITRDKRSAERHEHELGGPSAWAQLSEGFHYLWTHRVILRLMGLVLVIWFIAGMFNAGLNQLMIGLEGMGLKTYGLVFGTIGLGMFTGAIVTGLTCRHVRPRRVLGTALFVVGTLFLLTRVTLPAPETRVASLFVIAGSAGGVIVTLDTMYQRVVPNAIRGRIFAINFLSSTSALIVGMGCFLLMDGRGVGARLVGLFPGVFTVESVYFQLLCLPAFVGAAFVWTRTRAPITAASKVA
jgi:MFS family permease